MPMLGIVAASSNAGKTTLITALIPELLKSGVRVSVIKHAHHKFDIDHPGKDSYEIREAGAIQTLIASDKRWALMTEIAAEPDLALLVTELNPKLADLIIVEGFKQAQIPKIEVYRPSINDRLLAESDATIIAVATDVALNIKVPVLDLNDTASIATFILEFIQFAERR